MSPTLRRRPKEQAPDAGAVATVETPPVAPELPGRDGFPDVPRPSRRERRAEARAAAAEEAPEALPPAARERRRTVAHSAPVLLLRAAHPRLALLTAGGLAVAAAIAG